MNSNLLAWGILLASLFTSCWHSSKFSLPYLMSYVLFHPNDSETHSKISSVMLYWIGLCGVWVSVISSLRYFFRTFASLPLFGWILNSKLEINSWYGGDKWTRPLKQHNDASESRLDIVCHCLPLCPTKSFPPTFPALQAISQTV